VRYGISVTDVRRDRHGRVVGIMARDHRGRPFSETAAIVIGADGVRSTVADRVHAGVERAGTGASSIVYGYWSGVEADGYEWIFRPKAAAGIIPTNDGQVCVFAGSTPGRIGRGGIDALRAVLFEASPDAAARVWAGNPPRGVRTFSGLPGFVRRSWGPGWALVGDAGYWKDPLSAHGLTDALRDAELLARAVTAFTSGEQSPEDALRAYQETRDRLSEQLFETVDAIAGQRWTDDEIPGLLLQMSSAMTDEVEALAALDAVRVP